MALVLLLAAVGVAGCAAKGGFSERMDGFIGQPLESAKTVIGGGYAERTLDDGRRVVVWTWYEPGASQGYRPPDTVVSMAGGRSVVVIPGEAPLFDRETSGLCEISFVADTSGTIQNWQAIGTNCQGRVP